MHGSNNHRREKQPKLITGEKSNPNAPTDEWINKMWCIHTLEYYGTFKTAGRGKPVSMSI